MAGGDPNGPAFPGHLKMRTSGMSTIKTDADLAALHATAVAFIKGLSGPIKYRVTHEDGAVRVTADHDMNPEAGLAEWAQILALPGLVEEYGDGYNRVALFMKEGDARRIKGNKGADHESD